MQDKDLLTIWKSYDEKMDAVLSINKALVFELTKGKLNQTIGRMRRPKIAMLLIGIPYTLLLLMITGIAYAAGALFVMIGFGTIAFIMAVLLIFYSYHLHLINQISSNDEILLVQEKLSTLKITSFNCTRIAVLQLPFWSICWMSLTALKSAPLLYGGVNLLIFFGMAYLSYWLYSNLSLDTKNSNVSRFFLRGTEWEPILQSGKILEQLKEYQRA